ncbi:MAG TPA: hypothetical protein VFZ27_04045 [Terriglobia bacterium]|nr:hypothetical protein [Terriglobia bacterium]
MGRSWWGLVPAFLIAAIGLHVGSPSELAAAELKPKTVQAFNQYVALAEARMKRDQSHPNDFLYIDSLPRSEYDTILNTLRKGDIFVQQIDTHAEGKDSFEVPDGMIHHWVGDVFIPGKSVTSALDILRDYDNFKNIYNPEVVRSRLVGRGDKDDYKVYMRLQKNSVVTVTLDTWYDIHFTPIGDDSGYSRSVSTRIQQVDDAGTPHEHLEPVGHDSGYLWRITSYWRYQKRDNGVIIEWESISLSRDVPFLVAWFVNPLIRRIAHDAVTDMLTATRKAVLTEKRQNEQANSTQ